jgi:hypothetical protein
VVSPPQVDIGDVRYYLHESGLSVIRIQPRSLPESEPAMCWNRGVLEEVMERWKKQGGMGFWMLLSTMGARGRLAGEAWMRLDASLGG